MKSLRLSPVTIAIVAVFALVAVYAASRMAGYSPGRDAALRDNRSDAALQAQQNVEG